MKIVGAKLYLAAFTASCFMAKLTLAESPIPLAYQADVGWGLGIIVTGCGFVLGVEVIDAVRAFVYKLAGQPPENPHE